MLPRMFAAFFCAGVLAVPAAAAEPETAALRASIERLQAEVTALRAAVARLELQRQRDVVRQVSAELEAVRAEQTRLVEAEHTRAQDLADLDEWLNRGPEAAQQNPDAQAARMELASEAQQTGRRLEAARVRESELLRALLVEEQKTKALERATQTLGGRTQ